MKATPDVLSEARSVRRTRRLLAAILLAPELIDAEALLTTGAVSSRMMSSV